MKPLVYVGLLLAALFSVGAYIRFVHDPALLETAEAKLSSDSLDRALATKGRADSLRFAQRDSVLVRDVVRVQVRVDTLIVRATVADSVFVRELPDSLKAPFLAVEALKDSVIAGQKIVILDQRQQIALRDTALAEKSAALTEALKERDRWMHIARPGFFLRMLRELPALIVGAAGGLVIRSILPH